MSDDALPGVAELAAKLMGGPVGDAPSWPIATLRRLADEWAAKDAEEAARAGIPYQCRGSGCWGCCRGDVAVLRREVNNLLPIVSDDALREAWRNREALKDPARSRRALCPLLDRDSGRCTVYDRRPITCRVYHAITPADLCFPERVGAAQVGTRTGPVAFAVAVHMAHVLGEGPDEIDDPALAVYLVWEAERRGLTGDTVAEGGVDV